MKQFIRSNLMQVWQIYIAILIAATLIQFFLILQINSYESLENGIRNNSILQPIMLFGLISLAHETFWRIKDYFLVIITAKIRTNIFKFASDLLVHKNVLFFKDNNSASVLSVIRVLSESLTVFLKVLIEVFGVIIYILSSILYLDHNTKIILLIFLLIWFIVYLYTMQKSVKISDQIGDLINDYTASLLSSINNIDNIWIYGSNALEKTKFYHKSNAIMASEIQFGSFLLSRWVIQGYLFIGLTLIAIYNMSGSGASCGRIISVIALLRGFFSNLWSLSAHFQLIIESYGRIYNSLKILETTKRDDYEHNIVRYSKYIKLQNIRHHFEDGILTCENIEIKAGEKVLVYGSSGSGKTTLVQIILGLIRPENGNIVNEFYKKISYIPQNPYLFDGSILYNIEYGGCIDINMLKRYKSLSFIWKRKCTIKLSRGQIQKILFARALIKNNDIIIMDEPTASMDTESATELLSAVWKKYPTIIIISHDISIRDRLPIDKVLVSGKDFKLD